MPQFTIDLPDELMPVLRRKAQALNRSIERFLSDYLVMCLENEEMAPGDARREALEDILEERDKGPFVRSDDSDAFVERIMAGALARVEGDAIAFAKEHQRQ